MVKEEVKSKSEPRFSLGQVATQTEIVIIDNEEVDKEGEKTQYGIQSALAKILNDLEELKKGLL